MKVAAIVPAAGKARRFKSKTSKLFHRVFGKPLLVYTLLNLRKAYPFTEIILAVDFSQKAKIHRLLMREKLKNVHLVAGGKTRAESVRNGLKAVSEKSEWVLVHDAARPLVTKRLVREVLRGAIKSGAALCALPATATVKKIKPGQNVVIGTEKREALFLAQTPQVFKKKILLGRYQKLGARAFQATDEAALFDGSGIKVKVVPGEIRNIKITSREDLELFKFYSKNGKGKAL